MRSLRRSDRGLSEIVGTLMLIVIVVSAATLLAAFVASYQKQLQTQEAYTHDQSLESLKILGLSTALNSTGTAYSNITFRLADESVEASSVIGIALNAVVLYNYSWEDLVNQTWSSCSLSAACVLSLSPQQQVIISTNDQSFVLGPAPLPNQYLKIDVYTDYQNDFRQVFLPPAPIALVSETNPSGNNPITLLDGSTSFQPGGNASLVNWAWNVTGGGLSSTGTNLLPATFPSPGNGELNTTSSPSVITVRNATAIFSIPTDFGWATGDGAVFSLSGENLAVTGTSGTCSLSDSTVTGSHGVAAAGSLLVTFNFTTTLSSGCTNATISLTPSGVTFLAVQGQSIALATGEETEISPSFPNLPADDPVPFVVTLQVLNSDGLTGSVSITYTPST